MFLSGCSYFTLRFIPKLSYKEHSKTKNIQTFWNLLLPFQT